MFRFYTWLLGIIGGFWMQENISAGGTENRVNICGANIKQVYNYNSLISQQSSMKYFSASAEGHSITPTHGDSEPNSPRAADAKSVFSRSPATLLFKSGNAKCYQRRLAQRVKLVLSH